MRATRLRSMGFFELGIERIDVHREPPLFPKIVKAVLVGGHGGGGVHLQAAGQRFEKLSRVLGRVAVIFGVLRDESRILPDGDPVLAPVAGERPPGQQFAGIPLALPVVEKRTGRKMVAQFVEQFDGELAFGGAQRVARPLGAVGVIERNKRRLTAHGQPHVSRAQLGVHRVAQRFDVTPLAIGVGLGDARRFVNSLNATSRAEIPYCTDRACR